MTINQTTTISNVQSNTINKTVASSSIEKKPIKDDEFDLNQKITAIDMYNSTLGSLGGIFKNNEKLKDNIISSIEKMTFEEKLGFIMITLPFEVGNIETGVPEKDKRNPPGLRILNISSQKCCPGTPLSQSFPIKE